MVQYIVQHSGKNIAIVFDEYHEDLLNKDKTHLQCRLTKVGPDGKRTSNSVMSQRQDISS